MNPPDMPLLRVSALRTEVPTPQGRRAAVDGVDLHLHRGETVVLLGESGSGKSLTALSLMRLLSPGVRIVEGSVLLDGTDVLGLTETQMRAVRGQRMAMIFQEPMTALNPVLTVGSQIAEALRRHGMRRRPTAQRVVELLTTIGIADPVRRASEFPHQLSGGMRQRVMIAMALAGDPAVLIADEPTTALDVTTQAQILALLKKLQHEHGMGLLLVTHDLGVAAQMADRVVVMRQGKIVESATRNAFFAAPQHPYSQRLFGALPSLGKRGQPLTSGNPGNSEPSATPAARHDRLADSARPLLDVRDLKVHFPIREGWLGRHRGSVRAVDGVSFNLHAGRTLAVVGESGCGKTTLGKAMLHLLPITGGSVDFAGQDLATLPPGALRRARRNLQIVFQDPFGSLNPRMRVAECIAEGLVAQGIGTRAQQAARVAELLALVGLPADSAQRYPHEFSGGQRQRISIARALAPSPRLLVCDEPTSALDLSVQAQILDLLRTLQAQLNLAFVFVTHNLAVVEYLAHEVAVMYLGRIVEQGPAVTLLTAPAHPYTQALLAAVPRVGTQQLSTAPDPAIPAGEPPSPTRPPAGCHYHPRCPRASELCARLYPEPRETVGGQVVACHHPLTSVESSRPGTTQELPTWHD